MCKHKSITKGDDGEIFHHHGKNWCSIHTTATEKLKDFMKLQQKRLAKEPVTNYVEV